jgi:hypothetical protein
MKSALSQPSTIAAREFADGLGVRTVIAERGTELLELLSINPEFVSVPAFEFALRERVSRLANFRHAYYARVRRVDRLEGGKGLGVVSEHATGSRLSHILEVAERHSLDLDVNAALCLIRQIVPAIAMLHHNARDVAHGLVAPERILVTPQARIVITDYVLGSAVEQLHLSRERLWRDLQAAIPPGAGHPRLDHRADVMQIGVVSLSLVLGRRLGLDELRGLSEMLASATETTVLGEREPISPPLRRWLARALQLDPRSSFESAEEAQRGLDDVLSEEGGYVTAPIALEAFLTSYRQYAALGPDPDATAAPAPEPQRVTRPEPSRPSSSASSRQEVRAERAAPAVSAYGAPEPAPSSGPSLAVISAAEPVYEDPVSVTAQTYEPVPVVNDEPNVALAYTSSHREAKARKLERLALILCFLVAAGEGAYIWSTRAGAAAPLTTAGVIAVDSRPTGAGIVIDGRDRGVTPAEIRVSPGAHVLELKTGSFSRVLPLNVRAGVVHSQYIEMPSAETTGQVEVRGAVGARVLVDGQLRGAAPLTLTDLPPGEHDIAVESETGVNRQRVSVAAGATVVADFTALASLPPPPTAGWITVSAPYEMQILEEGRLIGTSASGRLELPPGRHTLELVNETLAFRTTTTVDVILGRGTRIPVRLPLGSISINATPWAEVWIDGERVGETPIGNLPVPIGPHEVVFKHPELGEQRHAVSVTAGSPARLSVNLKK